MNYSDLINSHLKYGTTEEDIKIRKGYEKIQENVVIAPWWSHDIFDNMNFKIEQVSEKVYNFYILTLSNVVSIFALLFELLAQHIFYH